MLNELRISGSHPTTVRYYEWTPQSLHLPHPPHANNAPVEPSQIPQPPHPHSIPTGSSPDAAGTPDVQPRKPDAALHAETPARPRAVIQLVHGMVEHLGRYAPLAEYLTEHGYVVVGADHRGHGLSANTRNPLGYFGDGVEWEDLVEDIHAVRLHASKRYPDLPYVIFGHSMGSFMLRTYLMRHSQGLAGAAIVGTGLWPGTIATVGLALARAFSALHPRSQATILNAIAFGPYNKGFEHRTLFDWLSRDQANIDDYIADPLSGFVPSNAFFVQLLRGIQIANAEPAFHLPPELPLYIVSGELDPVGGAQAVRTVAAHYANAGSRDVTARIFARDRHEVFNETNKKQVWDDFAQWLYRVTA